MLTDLVEHHKVIKIIFCRPSGQHLKYTSVVLFYSCETAGREAVLMIFCFPDSRRPQRILYLPDRRVSGTFEVEKIRYVKCHTMGRSLCERRRDPRYGIASATALRWIFACPFCAVFFMPKTGALAEKGSRNAQKSCTKGKNFRQRKQG